MKGLEVSEVKLSEIDLGDRMDADYFEKNNLHIEQMLRKVRAKELRGFAYFVASAFYPAATQLYSIGDTPFIRCVDCINYPLITKRQDDTFEKIPMSFVLENDGINLLNRNDIVITKVGSPCYASLVYEHNVVALSRTVMGLKNINGINPFYLLVFLRSKYGFSQLLRARELTIQYQLTLERVKRIRVFVPEESFQLQIEQMVKSAHAKLEESKQLYTEAENVLLEELGLKNWQPKNENINVKTLSESFSSSGRLDAEYYQSKYDEIEDYLKQNNQTDLLGNICFVNQKNTKPKDKEQYKYIELSNINTTGEITGCTIDYGEKLPSRARQVVKTGDVIVSSVEGSLDSCALVTPEYDNAFCSTGFYIIRSKAITSETLLVLMKLKPIQQLLKKGCSGTILTAINYDNFCNIIIPVPDGKIQTEISSKIQRCFALKAESKRLLEEAKMMVEQEIEKGGE